MKHLFYTDGEISGSKTWLFIFASITAVKFMLSGLTIGELTFPMVSINDVMILIGAMGAYVARRATDKKE